MPVACLLLRFAIVSSVTNVAAFVVVS